MNKRVFGDRYKVTERIGMGGMAEVFKANDTTLGRTVAVKVMLPQYAADRTFAARFRQEAQAAANLTSPFIVNIYDWGRDDDMYYIVMEYVRGTDLKTAVQQRGSIHPRKVAEIGSQVCSALSVAHSYGIIHRDIKSANIMVQTDGNVKVMDFGIAQAGNMDMTTDSNVLGTAHYVSPEQAQGKPLAGTSDLYSLGVVMYEACTGQLPFDGPDAVSVAMKQVNEDPIPPRAINANIDPALEAIILRAMSKSPWERFSTANEMKQALDDYLAGRGAAASAAATTVISTPGAAAAAGATRVIDPVEAGAQSGAVKSSYERNPRPSSGGDDDGGKKGGLGKVVAGLVAVLLIGVLGFAGVTLLNNSKTEKVIVPDVTNHTLQEATEILEEFGLNVGVVKYEANETVEKDLVFYQDPAFNDSIAKDGKVNLVISSGKGEGEQVPVPNLLGLTDIQAQKALLEAGFTASSNEEFSDDYDEGKVCRQEPANGETAAKGSAIRYWVSKGKANTNVVISNYFGWKESDALADLQKQGLKVNTETGYSNDVATGEVMGQSISAGTSVAAGTTITLKISLGAEDVAVPNVVGMGQSKASATLKNAGFTVKVRYDVGPKGKVLDQDVTGTAKPGTAVTITVGEGEDE